MHISSLAACAAATLLLSGSAISSSGWATGNGPDHTLLNREDSCILTDPVPGLNLEASFFLPRPASEGVLTGDFNGDGFQDLAVGASGEAPGLDPESGGVNIIPFVELEL